MEDAFRFTKAFAEAERAISSKLEDGESVVWKDEEAYLFGANGLGVRIGSLSDGAFFLADRVAARRMWLADPDAYLIR